MRLRALVGAVVTTIAVTFGLSACGGGQTLGGTVELVQIADVDTPTAFTTRAGDDLLYVAEQDGRVVSVDDSGTVETVLDITDHITAGGEQGLLGLAFSPDGTKLYVHYSAAGRGDTRLDEYELDGSGEPVLASRRRLLSVRQPAANHNGGQLAFGPDEMLYLALGDGGDAGDQGPGHKPGGNAQSLDSLLGKILRVDPAPSGSDPYTIPDDNPFVDDDDARPEIWAYGLRNPWRFSFDAETGDLWIGDVGEGEWEEIDVAHEADGGGRGVNYGWNVFEADEQYRDGAAPEHVAPLLALSHARGFCSVIGGYVYRGTKIPELEGAYVYADYCNGRLRYVRESGGEVHEKGSLGVELDEISSFGQDDDGELYVLSQSSGLYRIEPA